MYTMDILRKIIIINNISGFLYSVHIRHSVRLKACFNIQYFPARYEGLRLNYETYFFNIAPCNGIQGAVAQYAASQSNQVHRGEPLLFSISALGSFTCVTQHTGPTALGPTQRTSCIQWIFYARL